MSDPIDRIVKGAPPPDVSAEQVAASAKAAAAKASLSSPSGSAPVLPLPSSSTTPPHDPRDALPSSPPQIYLNLLILESSLRLQYLSLRARLRLHVLLLGLLAAWVAVFTYLLFLRPREDGSGVGGSVYWVLESAEKLGWSSGVVTSCLFLGTGMYERGVRWPRKFVATTNRGLRGFNLKVVVVKRSFLAELAGWIAVLDPLGVVRERRVNFQIVPKDIEANLGPASKDDQWQAHAARHGLAEEDIAPGGDVLRVLFLPKPFSPDFREGWDSYRVEYWERENARRASLRALVTARQREIARREGGWLWWTGWRGWKNVRIFTGRKTRRQRELEKLALTEKTSVDRLRERRKKDGLWRDGAHSNQSSRSSTPDPDAQRHRRGTDSRPGEKRDRRGSSSHSTGSGSRRSRRPTTAPSEKSRLSATETLLQDSRNALPAPTPLSRRSSIPPELHDGSWEVRAEDRPVNSRQSPASSAGEMKAESVEA